MKFIASKIEIRLFNVFILNGSLPFCQFSIQSFRNEIQSNFQAFMVYIYAMCSIGNKVLCN